MTDSPASGADVASTRNASFSRLMPYRSAVDRVPPPTSNVFA